MWRNWKSLLPSHRPKTSQLNRRSPWKKGPNFQLQCVDTCWKPTRKIWPLSSLTKVTCRPFILQSNWGEVMFSNWVTLKSCSPGYRTWQEFYFLSLTVDKWTRVALSTATRVSCRPNACAIHTKLFILLMIAIGNHS